MMKKKLDLDKSIEQLDLIIQEAMLQVKQNNGEQDQLVSRCLVPDVGSTQVTRGDTVQIVGLEEETRRLIDQLTSHESNRHAIPIVGMGGLGKTALATYVYNHPALMCHFDVKAWVTVSQVYTTRTLIATLLHGIGICQTDEIGEEELGDQLYKGLFGMRYLIIIDDIRDIQAWNEIRRFFPDTNNCSRIILTTRLLNVAISVDSCSPLELKLLDVDQSWNLLSKTVFEQEACPPELEICGKEIAKNCKGLPLAIVVIGGLLKVSDRTLKHWEHVGRNIRSIIGLEDNEHCMKILSFSYHQLPIHLKPCFLYLGTFPEDYKIKVSEVTKLWAAEGLLKPTINGKTLDEVGLGCLTDLIDRNLVIVKKRSLRGRMKHLILHDLVRDLCIKEAQKEKFLYVDDGVVDLPNSIESQHRLVVHGNGNRIYISWCATNGTLSVFVFFHVKPFLPGISGLSLLRVLYDSMDCRVHFAEDIMQLVNLRLLKFSIGRDELNLLSSISWAMNLETLILSDVLHDYSLPDEIWNLWRLKHLICVSIVEVIMPDPPIGSDFVHANLQTLKGVKVLSDIVLYSIPSIRILHIWYDDDNYNFFDFGHCEKLEGLHFGANDICSSLERNYKFPSYLRKLTLWTTELPWESMTTVGSLPNLESLYLGHHAFEGYEWKSVEGEFQKLTCLKIDNCNGLVRWTVEDSSHFPSLAHLEVKLMNRLEEIPSVFGELMTLESIKVSYCSRSVVVSARKILEQQKQEGDTDVVVNVLYTIPHSVYTVELKEELKEELEGLPNDNFHLDLHIESF